MQRQPSLHPGWQFPFVSRRQPCQRLQSHSVGPRDQPFVSFATTKKSRHSSYTLPFTHRRNISRLALNPAGTLLLSVDEDGRAVLTHLPRRLALHRFSFNAPLSALAFSPSGRHFAAGVGRLVEIWHAPSAPSSTSDDGLEFAPFVRHRAHAAHHDAVERLEWSSDSRFFLSSSKDLTARMWSMSSQEDFTPTTLGGHKEPLIGAWFSGDQEAVSYQEYSRQLL